MDYRIDLIGDQETLNVPIQTITVPCGVVPNLLFYTFGQSNARVVFNIVDSFDIMRVISTFPYVAYPKATKPFTPYLPDYMSAREIGNNTFNYTSNVETDCCLFGYLYHSPNPDDQSEVVYNAFKLRIQFRNINQFGVYDGYQYQ